MKRIFTAAVVILMANAQVFSQNCIKGDCQNGVGTIVYPTGAKYVGDFRQGRIEGSGTLYFVNGNVYTGQWAGQMRDGRGKMAMKNGNIYEGQFSKNKMQGSGTMAYSNGDKYTGNWQNDQPQGAGKYLFKSGERYEGNFVSGQFDGTGTMHYPDGAKYTGGWKANRKNGSGKYFASNGEVTQGTWANGELTGDEKPTASTASISAKPSTKPTTKPTEKPSAGKPNLSGLRDCGTVNCGNGKGYYKYGDGSIWVGTFQEGYPEGAGTCFYANADRYEGGWSKGAPHGEGVMFFSSGRVYGAVWLYGSPVRELDSQEDVPTEAVNVEASKNVKIWALCVGVGRYEHMPTLRYPDDDAYQVYAFLKSPEGGALPDGQIKVLVDEDANRDNILRAMRSLFLKADENDVVLLYFSGHGLEGSFLPADYDGYANKIRHEEVKDVFNQSRAKHKLCIADACHSGSLLASKSPMTVTLDKYYQAFEDSDGGTALLMSSKGEELSLEDNGLRQGVFSHYLLKGMKGGADANRDAIVTIQELYEFVYQKVRSYTGNQQSPVLTGSFDKNMPVAVIRK